MPFRNALILLVESNDRTVRSFAEYFRRQGLAVTTASGITEANHVLQDRKVSMMIVDWMLPDPGVLDFCAQTRKSYPLLPIILQTDPSDFTAQLDGFTNGVDDCWANNIPLSLYAAKSKAMLRRSIMRAASDEPIILGGTIVDLRTRSVVRGELYFRLKEKEYGIMRALVMEDGAPIRRELLLARIWGQEAPPVARTVDNYIVSLRRKIELDPANPRYLLTVPGVGYRLSRDVEFDL